jgi:hypothetical protein
MNSRELQQRCESVYTYARLVLCVCCHFKFPTDQPLVQGVGNTLKKHYETYLLEYELAHDDVDGECCILCHR